MVGGQQRQPSPSALTPQLDAWLKRLQRSLSVEADHGFGNLQGHSSSFCVFAEQCCAKGEPTLPATELPPLQRFAKALNGYVSLNTDQRRRLVTQLRQHLHQLRQRLDPPAPPAAPRLRLAESPAAGISSSSDSSTYEPQQPLAEVKGVGPKLATRLAQLGLLTLEDLILSLIHI